MIQVPGKISRENFKKMLAGSRGYLPSKVVKELKKGGMSQLLHKSSISKEQAIKAVRYLRSEAGDKPVISKFKSPSQLYREAALKQQKENLANQEVKRQKHIQTRLRMDVAEEATAIERGRNPYDPRSAIGQSLAEEIAKEQEERTKKYEQQRRKKEEHDKLQTTKGTRSELTDLDKLTEMDIG